MRLGACICLSTILSGFAWPGWSAAPNVVVSIQPIGSLVAGVMSGVGDPSIIVPPGASVHDFALRPSHAAKLSQADVVFWVGDGFEVFLEKPMTALASDARAVALANAAGVVMLPARDGGLWEPEDHAHDDDHDTPDRRSDHDSDDHDRHDRDGHIWLDPANAAAMTAAIAGALSSVDPENAGRYNENARALTARIALLAEELDGRFARVRATPFVVFHDAYQYLDRRFGLNAVGAITVSPERPPGARRIAQIKNAIAERGAACVFAEPQFEPRLISTLIEGTSAKSGVLDPEGSQLEPGPELYFALMNVLADNLIACLSGQS